MAERTGLALVLEKHLWSLRSPGAKRMTRRSRFLFVGLPLLLGVVAGVVVWLGLDVSNGVAQLLSALALLVGGMMTTFVFLTNLRVKVEETTETLQWRRELQRSIAGTVASCLYLAGAALVVAVLLVAVASISFLRSPGAAPGTVGVIVACGSHLAVNMLSMLKRLFGVYYDVFKKDFGPDLKLHRAERNGDHAHGRNSAG